MRCDVELLRIIAAFGIVWFHSGYMLARDVAYGDLVVFLILSSYFAMRSRRPHSIRERALSLLVPCVIWSMGYALLHFVSGRDIFPSDDSILSSMLSTPSIHLWYLPYIFICILLIDIAKKYVSPTATAPITALFAVALLLTSPVWREFSFVAPFGQYLHGFPAILIGIFLSSSSGISVKLKLTLTMLLVVAVLTVLYWQEPGVGVTYFVGALAAGALLFDKSFIRGRSWVFQISELTFGIYLVHPFFIYVFQYLGVSGVLLPVLSFIFSTVSIYLTKLLFPKKVLRYVL